jgi:hypothetical protein
LVNESSLLMYLFQKPLDVLPMPYCEFGWIDRGVGHRGTNNIVWSVLFRTLKKDKSPISGAFAAMTTC